MTDYSDLVERLRRDGIAARDTLKCVEMAPTVAPEDALKAADAIEALQMELAKLEVHCLYVDAGSKVDTHKIAELEHQLKLECDTYLWERKRMSRRIAFLEYWMERLFKYVSSPEARRNELTMATEIPDSLIREGENILHHLEERSDLEKVDGII